jgi:hypothetical protein
LILCAYIKEKQIDPVITYTTKKYPPFNEYSNIETIINENWCFFYER